ncbi:MAG: hypothetical protein IJS58_02075 [Bacilli bacterium]|nr:hypothetical protein [Bacilli bacterium]
MAKQENNKKEKKPVITTKKKMDNSIEVQVNRPPSKTVSGRILVWIICICTFLGVVLGLVAIILQAFGVF